MPRLRVVARKRAPRCRGGAEEYRLTLKFRWPNGHTMSFVANDTISAPLMHRTIIPALRDAFPVETRGVPGVEVTDDDTISAPGASAARQAIPDNTADEYRTQVPLLARQCGGA